MTVPGVARGRRARWFTPVPGSSRWAQSQSLERPGSPQTVPEFRVLGPIEAAIAGQPVDLGAPKQRALLALLLSRAGQQVAVDLILEDLWAGNPPPAAMTSVQAYVANLRRVLEPDRAPRTPATVLRTRGAGYMLDVRVGDVDVHRFQAHATAGWQALDRGDPREALGQFEAGLALWRGRPYAEVADAASVMPEVSRLEELRLSVTEARCAALLAVGAHEVAVAELGAFIQANPLREYGCELLSLALYRAGRQADALGVLQANKKRLAEELGIDPRQALQRLEREILNHSPALDWQPLPAAPQATDVLAALPDAGGDREIAEMATVAAMTAPREAARDIVAEILGQPAEQHREQLMTFPVGTREMLDAASRIVPPPAYADARGILARHRVVVLVGEPGTGRRTAALALLHSLRGQVLVRPAEIEPDGEPPTVIRLPLGHRRAFLLHLNDPETDAPAEAFGRDLLAEHAGRLETDQSYLVITVSPRIWAACARSAASITVRLGQPDPGQVCERHLRAGGLGERISWLNELGIESFLKSASRPRDMARLALRIGAAPDTDAGRRDVVSEHAGWRRKVRELFGKNPAPADRAFVLASAGLGGSPAQLVLHAADKLLEKTGGSVPAVGALAGEPLSDRLDRVDIDPDSELISVSGHRRDLDHAILLHAWDQWPRCQGTLLEWLADPLPPGAGDPQSLAEKLADALLCLAVEREPGPVMEALRRWWTGSGRRELAVRIISAAATDDEIGDRVRHHLYGWARQAGDRDLARTVADVCAAEFGLRYPDLALIPLRHLAGSEDEATSGAVVRVLSRLAGQACLTSSAAKEIAHWIGSGEAARQRTGRAAFLELAASRDPTGELILLRPDGPLPDLAVAGWRAHLDEWPGMSIDGRVAALAGWFGAALPDSPRRAEALRILAAAAGSDPARNLVLLSLCRLWADQADTRDGAERRLAVRQELALWILRESVAC
ncbi:MAG: BTAD domain-containing putative transcriptional regulator [Trebonia sp.]